MSEEKTQETSNESLNLRDAVSRMYGDTSAETDNKIEDNISDKSEEGKTQIDGQVSESTDKTDIKDNQGEDILSDGQELDQEDNNTKPQYKDKNIDDIISMHENASKKISQQNNEIYNLKKKFEELSNKYQSDLDRSNQEKINKEEKELLSDYSDDDIQVIKRIVQKELSQKELKTKQKSEIDKQSVISDHENLWELFQKTNPVLFNENKNLLLSEMREDINKTFYKKGWLIDRISSLNDKKDTNKIEIKKKRTGVKKVTSVPAGGVVTHKPKVQKTAEEIMYGT